MTDAAPRMHVTLHLVQQTTVGVNSADLWPMHGPYARFGADLASFAEEVMRRLTVDQYLGFHSSPTTITVIPRDADRLHGGCRATARPVAVGDCLSGAGPGDAYQVSPPMSTV